MPIASVHRINRCRTLIGASREASTDVGRRDAQSEVASQRSLRGHRRIRREVGDTRCSSNRARWRRDAPRRGRSRPFSKSFEHLNRSLGRRPDGPGPVLLMDGCLETRAPRRSATTTTQGREPDRHGATRAVPRDGGGRRRRGARRPDHCCLRSLPDRPMSRRQVTLCATSSR